MSNMKIAIIYYSSTGNNYNMANMAADAAKEAGAEVKVLKVKELVPEDVISENPAWEKHYKATKDVPEASLEDLDWADVIVFSAPTRFGSLPAQMKQFLDSTGPLWQKGKLVNKIVTAMTSAMNAHGGQEATLLNLYTTMYHWGALVVAPGYTDDVIYAAGGNPYGTSVSVDMEGKMQGDKDSITKAIHHQVKRAISVAESMK
ncbi:NAD(P)H:quinone oxidoreductase [Fulvivirga ligni]|uniref:NAD(P)H:quinone oxidoreductase n=1 Tax=Fulvivirga ligni TaxID=2904246 RepID=UPI001F1C655E|nr:NAD(P)H:quinone oxidoreductase [Fulvivirga ligni]UII19726.1 NAD(P)H:quinone oxidoreductase [Fulvivirga ligni]